MAGLRKMARNTAVLTVSSVFMRCIGMAYQVWLAGRIGAAGIGLFQLVMSVNFLCVTVAISGIRFTTTRLVSEELGTGRSGNVGAAVMRCCGYAAFFGFAAAAGMLIFAEPIGFLWIGDARTVASLRIISFRMPFIAFSSVLNGYFIASGRVWKSAAVQVAEQLINIALVMLLLPTVEGGDIESACALICVGGTAADIASFLMIAAVYVFDRRAHGERRGVPSALTSRMLKTALPLALSVYARTTLSTLEDLMVPRALKKFGLGADAALGGYGTVTGMAFPIISFPSCVLSALAEMTVPELTEAQTAGDWAQIRRTVITLLKNSLLFSLAVAALIFFSADALGLLIYKNAEVGQYLRLLALIIPIMYLDIVTDGCLKGLGQMMNSMFYNITEALLGVALVAALVPRMGLAGFVAVLFICEIFNFILSIQRLWKVVRRGTANHLTYRQGFDKIKSTYYSVPRLGSVRGKTESQK
ncbi:MAG: oligosaccharide flippase family protein [Oscillospiraceae bacterium]|nr:oligosaccharide flippase family protein [Oscillospiraceae bacterium]